MKQKEKQLLLADLCARLSYRVKVLDNSHKNYGVSKLINIGVDGSILIDNEINDIQYYPIIDDVKPYLRPMSSMTEEEKSFLVKNYRFYYNNCDDGITNGIYSAQFNRTIYQRIDERDILDIVDWLNKYHFDYRGLIEKGLALEAPKDMYETFI